MSMALPVRCMAPLSGCNSCAMSTCVACMCAWGNCLCRCVCVCASSACSWIALCTLCMSVHSLQNVTCIRFVFGWVQCRWSCHIHRALDVVVVVVMVAVWGGAVSEQRKAASRTCAHKQGSAVAVYLVATHTRECESVNVSVVRVHRVCGWDVLVCTCIFGCTVFSGDEGATPVDVYIESMRLLYVECMNASELCPRRFWLYTWRGAMYLYVSICINTKCRISVALHQRSLSLSLFWYGWG